MGTDKIFDEHCATKDAMAAIINKHMQAAFEEIEAKFGDTSTSVIVELLDRHGYEPASTYPRGKYLKSILRLGAE